ncbi:hypothetical protein EYR38_009051 [Pleurotus pulmonarius]|nr:hypothetical protein EYR38_009051 [Pleurotus pulmonarius]
MPAERLVKTILSLLPGGFKARLFRLATRISAFCGFQIQYNVYRLPFNIIMKTSSYPNPNEAQALRIVESFQGVEAPRLIDYVEASDMTYVLMTRIKGVCTADIWESLTPSDKDKIVAELRMRLNVLQEQTKNRHPAISSAMETPIRDPRIPWLWEDDPRIIYSSREFFQQVWLGLDFPHHADTLRPAILPLVERQGVDIVFCHGDILPKNIMLPGGLEMWRSGSAGPLVLIDWEYAGWMPSSWEALKATWLTFEIEEDEDGWYGMMKEVFREDAAVLEADWLWRSTSGIPIV